MQKFTDPQYLAKDQYKDSSNLGARIALHQKFSTNPQGWHTWVFDQLLQLPVNANILELGCGNAVLWKESAKRIPAGWNITLTDLSDGMLDSAWRNLVVTGRGFKFEKIDAQSIPYVDGTFDAVIANHMLYHLPDRKQGLREIKRVLKDYGCLFATTVSENHMIEMWNWIGRVSGGKQGTVALSFTLENGKEQLQEFFPNVELTRYPDGLRVTDPGMIIKYIRSMVPARDLLEGELQSLDRVLVEMMGKNGVISISKDSGLFIARE